VGSIRPHAIGWQARPTLAVVLTGRIEAVKQATGPAPAVIGLLAAAAAALFVVLRILAHDGDVTALIRIGEDLSVAEERPDDLAVADNIGYDGQYYYRQALDPLSVDERVEGIPLDRPAYRSARIGYPAVVWALSLGGQRSLVPWVLAAVNVASVGVIAGLGAQLARDIGRRSWWGLLFAAWPGFVVALAYDLAEPLEAMLVVLGLLFLRRDRGWLAAAAFTGAILTRESALVVALAVLGAAALRALRRWMPAWMDIDRRPNHLVAAVVPIGVYAGWQMWMSSRWSEAASGSVRQSAEHVGSIPLTGLIAQLGDWLRAGDTISLYQMLQVLLIVLVFVILITALLRCSDAGTTVERVGLVGALLLVSALGGWDRTVVFMRWPGLAVMFGLIVHLACEPRRLPAWASTRPLAQTIGLLLLSTVPVWIFI
jgi:hypothetical protein